MHFVLLFQKRDIFVKLRGEMLCKVNLASIAFHGKDDQQ